MSVGEHHRLGLTISSGDGGKRGPAGTRLLSIGGTLIAGFRYAATRQLHTAPLLLVRGGRVRAVGLGEICTRIAPMHKP